MSSAFENFVGMVYLVDTWERHETYSCSWFHTIRLNMDNGKLAREVEFHHQDAGKKMT